MNFADFSVNTEPILMKLYTQFFSIHVVTILKSSRSFDKYFRSKTMLYNTETKLMGL